MVGSPVGSGPVYLVDDDQAVLKATARLLRAASYEVLTFASAADFLAGCSAGMSGCLVLDLRMPEIDGMQLQELLVERGCSLPIIFLSGHGDIPTSVRAVKRGATDFLIKPAEASVLLDAVEAALRKNSAELRARAIAAVEGDRFESLTPREREVMLLVVKGLLNKQIAATLGTVEKTVKVHRARVMRKLQVRSVADLVRLAERNGWTKV